MAILFKVSSKQLRVDGRTQWPMCENQAVVGFEQATFFLIVPQYHSIDATGTGTLTVVIFRPLCDKFPESGETS